MHQPQHHSISRASVPLAMAFLFTTSLVVFWRAQGSSVDWPSGALVWRYSVAEWRNLLGFGLGVVVGSRAAEPRRPSHQVLFGIAAALGLLSLRKIGIPTLPLVQELWLVLIWFAVPITFGFVGSHVTVKGRLLDLSMTLGAILAISGAAMVTFRWWEYYVSSHASGISGWFYTWEARSLLLALVAVWASVKRRPWGLVVAFLLTFSPVVFNATGEQIVAPSILYLVAACSFLLDTPLGRRFRSQSQDMKVFLRKKEAEIRGITRWILFLPVGILTYLVIGYSVGRSFSFLQHSIWETPQSTFNPYSLSGIVIQFVAAAAMGWVGVKIAPSTKRLALGILLLANLLIIGIFMLLMIYVGAHVIEIIHHLPINVIGVLFGGWFAARTRSFEEAT